MIAVVGLLLPMVEVVLIVELMAAVEVVVWYAMVYLFIIRDTLYMFSMKKRGFACLLVYREIKTKSAL